MGSSQFNHTPSANNTWLYIELLSIDKHNSTYTQTKNLSGHLHQMDLNRCFTLQDGWGFFTKWYTGRFSVTKCKAHVWWALSPKWRTAMHTSRSLCAHALFCYMCDHGDTKHQHSTQGHYLALHEPTTPCGDHHVRCRVSRTGHKRTAPSIAERARAYAP